MQIVSRKISEDAKNSLILEGLSPEMAKLYAAGGHKNPAPNEPTHAPGE